MYWLDDLDPMLMGRILRWGGESPRRGGEMGRRRSGAASCPMGGDQLSLGGWGDVAGDDQRCFHCSRKLSQMKQIERKKLKETELHQVSPRTWCAFLLLPSLISKKDEG